jgi:tRNA dimethylallyltransferase
MTYDAVLIAGPTAGGKSQAALAVASTIAAGIVNADAMQIYRELRILTARPSDDEMARARHGLYGHVSVNQVYSVGRYQTDAAQVLKELRDDCLIPVFVGGTGLYFTALTKGLADIPPVPASIRAAVRAKFDWLGADAFHRELMNSDPASAGKLRASDRQRMLRAAEVLEATGRSLAVWQQGPSRAVLDRLRVAKFVLDVPRVTLRARIAARLRAMIGQGALDEIAALEAIDTALPAAKVLGARELLALRKGLVSEEVAIARAVTRTCQYAKRQLTWARHRMADWRWISETEPDKIVAEILRHLA